MAKETKERILEAALNTFSRRGYAGTNLSDIAAEVGVVKSALYRHFESKEALWNGLLDRMHAYYTEHFGSEGNMPPIPQNAAELLSLTEHMMRFTVYDEKVTACRKLLLTEQFRNEKARALAAEHFSYGPEKLFKAIFEKMIKSGTMKAGDPAMAAFSFCAPISMLVHQCDREPEKREETISKALVFTARFILENRIP